MVLVLVVCAVVSLGASCSVPRSVGALAVVVVLTFLLLVAQPSSPGSRAASSSRSSPSTSVWASIKSSVCLVPVHAAEARADADLASPAGSAKTMDSLRSLASPNAHVVRDSKIVTVPSPTVVVGDIVEVKTGDTIPADLRLFETVNVRPLLLPTCSLGALLTLSLAHAVRDRRGAPHRRVAPRRQGRRGELGRRGQGRQLRPARGWCWRCVSTSSSSLRHLRDSS